MNKIKISENFYLSEFQSPDTKEVKIEEKLVNLLEEFREQVNRPLIINSGYRTHEHNVKVGGSPKSQHMEGSAVDIRIIEGYTSVEMADMAEKVGFDGIGIYNWGIHVDVRGYPAQWDWRGK